MIQEQHPITPPPELVQEWLTKCYYRDDCSTTDYIICGTTEYIINQAARWGADQELEACCKLLELSDSNARDFLYSARRPKPPTLKEQALEILELNNDVDSQLSAVHYNILRRALESLPD